MATYTLTNADEVIYGTSSADLFTGVSGGTDVLRGFGGNDGFRIEASQDGTIDGGTGTDRVRVTGALNNSFDLGLRFENVERFNTDNGNHYGTVAQFKAFSRFELLTAQTEFSIFLQGEGGALDLRSRYAGDKALNIEAEGAATAVALTGTNGVNQILGSDFSDRLAGAGGADTVRGGDGKDHVNGGTARDYLYGDDGKDSFVFNVAPTLANYDRIGDFRPVDDTIRLENAIFTTLAAGALSSSQFKDIGVGSADADDRVLYNSDTGKLYYDFNGSAAGGRSLIAILDNFAGDVPKLNAADILII